MGRTSVPNGKICKLQRDKEAENRCVTAPVAKLTIGEDPGSKKNGDVEARLGQNWDWKLAEGG